MSENSKLNYARGIDGYTSYLKERLDVEETALAYLENEHALAEKAFLEAKEKLLAIRAGVNEGRKIVIMIKNEINLRGGYND